ncbi:chromosome partitioning protein ParB, partial [Candidatus Uhrbacteria bacterium]|nr:chromosome partitioning protein ParB [Candidatus Uhrbacteria bacterium]
MMMKRQSGLGRGLGALIPQKQNEASAQNAAYDPEPAAGSAPEAVQVLDDGQRVYELPVEQVSPNTKQPRLIFD